MSCASPLAGTAPVAPAVPPPPPPPVPPVRRRQPHEDILGLLSLAFVLIALSVVFSMNPNLPTDLKDWSRIVSTANTILARPPEGIIVSAAWFFGVMGVLEFLNAAFRAALRWMPLRAAARALSGVGDLAFSALLLMYAARTISGTFLVAALAGVVGVLLLIYVTLGIYWSTARPGPHPQPEQPPAQQ